MPPKQPGRPRHAHTNFVDVLLFLVHGERVPLAQRGRYWICRPPVEPAIRELEHDKDLATARIRKATKQIDIDPAARTSTRPPPITTEI